MKGRKSGYKIKPNEVNDLALYLSVDRMVLPYIYHRKFSLKHQHDWSIIVSYQLPHLSIMNTQGEKPISATLVKDFTLNE